MPDAASSNDPFNAAATLDTPLGSRSISRLDALADTVGADHLARIPYCIKVLLEAALRRCDGYVITEDHVKAIAGYDAKKVGEVEIPFCPGRVVLQDFTGVPAVVDLAAMREAMVRMTGDKGNATKVNPLVPCDLVIDHSVQVDAFASGAALTINSQKEFERNAERYRFLKWGQGAFNNFRVVPPATGIIHQVNLEYLAKGVWDDGSTLYPDSLVGTDSHTTMINGLGVVGWGVGGIEAEAVMLGQPIYMLLPEVVGFKLTGKLKEGTTATDLVLTVTQMLREHGVVGKFVEFFGPGMATMPLADRATIANMAPEYGATMGFFPVDDQTLTYMKLTGRDDDLVDTVKQYCQTQGLWRDDSDDIVYTAELELDMGTVEPSLAGPKRPQDRIALSAMQTQWRQDLSATFGRASSSSDSTPARMAGEGGAAAAVAEAPVAGSEGVDVEYEGQRFKLQDGSVTIAAITSCTNTSNPAVMIAAGLVARNANKLGLRPKPWVKTSLAPGSKVVTEYYRDSGLQDDLDAMGFHLVGYGCTTCIGNSGPLPEPIANAVEQGDLVVASVLSGNRNFEGRVNPHVKANYLASPPLCVAYAIAGTVDIDLIKDPIATDKDGNDVYLKDIWPSLDEISKVVASSVKREQFTSEYANVFDGSQQWQDIETVGGKLYEWDDESTYIQEPPFFVGLSDEPDPIQPISEARCLVMVGDSVTTDHISPAGAIKKDSPAGQYLLDNGVPVSMFNSYGSRRGNDRVMVRGTFANIRVRNQLAPGTEGGMTTNLSTDEVTTIFDAAAAYGSARTSDPELANKAADEQGKSKGQPSQAADERSESGGDSNSFTPLIVLAGKDYGMGSSRDWAAKGTYLLGVRAVIAESYERIHRSNLVGMGVLPLQYQPGQTRETLDLTGKEVFSFAIDDNLKPGQDVHVTARDHRSGQVKEFSVRCRIDTPVEIDYYRNGGILHTVLRNMAKA